VCWKPLITVTDAWLCGGLPVITNTARFPHAAWNGCNVWLLSSVYCGLDVTNSWCLCLLIALWDCLKLYCSSVFWMYIYILRQTTERAHARIWNNASANEIMFRCFVIHKAFLDHYLEQLCPTQMTYWAKINVTILTRAAHWMAYLGLSKLNLA